MYEDWVSVSNAKSSLVRSIKATELSSFNIKKKLSLLLQLWCEKLCAIQVKMIASLLLLLLLKQAMVSAFRILVSSTPASLARPSYVTLSKGNRLFKPMKSIAVCALLRFLKWPHSGCLGVELLSVKVNIQATVDIGTIASALKLY